MNDKQSIVQRVLHLQQVEKLSQRQIAQMVELSRKRVKRILSNKEPSTSLFKTTVLEEYAQLIAHWYKEYPRLKATQIYERLKLYGYSGSYVSVARFSRSFRTPTKVAAYHPLIFVPGEEAQIDWFFFTDQTLGKVAGFLYVLAYSRYAWGVFYPRTSFEFFLAGHGECFQHIGGLAHKHRYDNLKSVVVKRSPELTYNPQFLDFARFYGFSLHACNPYKGNEKGRVERIIRDIRVFLYGQQFADIAALNRAFWAWLTKRNDTVHRSTGKTPQQLLAQERLRPLPHQPYPAQRILPSSLVSKTALVQFDGNQYSVPDTCAGKNVDIIAGVQKLHIHYGTKTVATHTRCFAKNQRIVNPLHSERLLKKSPNYKFQRILSVIGAMDPAFAQFLEAQSDEQQRLDAAYCIFCLMKTHSRAMLISAVRQLLAMQSSTTNALHSLLQLPAPKPLPTLWPKNPRLLTITYQERSLKDYDPDPKPVDPT